MKVFNSVLNIRETLSADKVAFFRAGGVMRRRFNVGIVHHDIGVKLVESPDWEMARLVECEWLDPDADPDGDGEAEWEAQILGNAGNAAPEFITRYPARG